MLSFPHCLLHLHILLKTHSKLETEETFQNYCSQANNNCYVEKKIAKKNVKHYAGMERNSEHCAG